MTGGDERHERAWEAGWDGHREAQQRRLAELPLWIRIEWLEETERVIRNLARSARDPKRPGEP